MVGRHPDAECRVYTISSRKGTRCSLSAGDVVEDMVIRDRRHLSEDGFVLPIIAMNKNSGLAEGLPEIVSRGFVGGENSGILQEARTTVARTLESSTPEERGDWGVMQHDNGLFRIEGL